MAGEHCSVPRSQAHKRESGAAAGSEPVSVLRLQSTAGNAAVAGLMASMQRRATDGGATGGSAPAGGGDHSLHLGGLQPAVDDAAAQGGTLAVPGDLRANAENALGQDLSGVRVHDDAASWAANGALGTAAFARGDDLFFRHGAFDPGSPSGAELVEHEMGHVVEQRRSGTRSAQGAVIDDSRVRVKAERDYAEAAETLETKLGPHLSAMPEPDAIADEMLRRLRQIVDAWAAATKLGTTKAYEQEFSFPTGTKYYGSFMLTAKEVKKVFEKPGQPLRKKLNLVYYATRNGNLAKYLELAANELKLAQEKGTTTAGQTVNVTSQTGKGKVTLKGGFAAASGLEGRWAANNPVLAGKTSKQEVDEDLAAHLGAAGTKMPTLGGFGAASKGVATNATFSKDKRYDTYKGLDLSDTKTLSRPDVQNITTAEMRLLYKRAGKRQPLWISSSDKTKFKAKNKRIMWEQGGQNIEIAPASDTRRIAEETMSRLEGGVSGSTDLMLHAAKHLGFDSADELKKLRLALVAWMLSNRDHSFFEIMKVAADYGVPFHIDRNNPGSEYETADNFYPLGGVKVANFSALMPGGHLPSYYLGHVHEGTVDNNLAAKGTSSDTYVADLRLAGLTLDDSWKGDPKSKDLAQWLAVKNLVAAIHLNPAHDEASLKQNRIAVQGLQKDQSWHHVNKPAVDANADANLRALLAAEHGAAAVVSDGDLLAAGVPAALLVGIEEYKRYDVLRLMAAVTAAAPGLKGATSTAHAEGVAKLYRLPVTAALAHWLGKVTTDLILRSIVSTVVGPARSTAREKAAATDLPKLVTFLNNYPTLAAQKAHVVSLGLPAGWTGWIERDFKDGIDSSNRSPSAMLFGLVQLASFIAGAGVRADQPPTSTANKAARKAILASAEFAQVVSNLPRPTAEAAVTAFLAKHGGAAATTAAEDKHLFGQLGAADRDDELTAVGVPRDLVETQPGLAPLLHTLRRAVVDGGFDITKAATAAVNKQSWTSLVTGAAFQAVETVLRLQPTKAITAAMVKSQIGAGVLGAEAATLALATEQRMAHKDKLRLGKTSVVNTATLATPAMHGEAPDPLKTNQRNERYWAETDSGTDLDTNIGRSGGARSPTIKAQLALWAGQLKTNPIALANEIDVVCTALVLRAPDPKPSKQDYLDMYFDPGGSPAEHVEALLSIIPSDLALTHVDAQVQGAVAAIANLSPRERGAIYQYTNKLHDQLGYATQQFSMDTDFTAQDLANTTDKLRSVPFMLPIIQALNSGLEQLPPYNAGVYSGRTSGVAPNLTVKTDGERRAFGQRAFRPGTIISYNYPLSSAKDVASSFIPKSPNYDVALFIQPPLLTGRDIEYLSNKPAEKEVLFPQGARFQVISCAPQPLPVDSRVDTNNKLWVTLKEV